MRYLPEETEDIYKTISQDNL